TSAHWPYQKDRRCSHHRSAVRERVLHQSWSDEHQQFALVISTVGVTEQCTDQWQITEERRLADGNNFFRTENTTQHHGFAIIDQYLRLYRVGIDAGTGSGQLTDGILVDDQIHDDAVIQDRKSTRLNSSHVKISYAVFCLKKKTT